MGSFFIVISLYIFMIVNPCILVKTFTVSDTITENKTFHYRQLSKYPSTRVTIDISLSNLGSNQKLNFYLFDSDGFTIERTCALKYPEPVQLRNENFYIPLNKDGYKYITCQFENNIRSCNGKMTIQDFEPRNVGFSLGISCKRVHDRLLTLKGLTYNITLRDMNNNSQCLLLESRSAKDCSKLYPYTTIPNLVGHQTEDEARSNMYGTHKILELLTQFSDYNCCQHLDEILCYAFIPKCDPDTKRMVPPCRESCLDFSKGCLVNVLTESPRLKMLHPDFLENVTSSDIYNAINCQHLPPANGSTPCFYKPVSCPMPPNGQHKFLINDTKFYPLGATYDLICPDGHVVTGNNTVTCLPSGKWSKLPECRLREEQRSMGPLPIVLTIFIVTSVIFLAILVRGCLIAKRPHIRELKRNRRYDAFVAYNFDADHKFVFESLLPELEEKHNPPFKLFTHDKDFELGQLIITNINYAIQNCNCVIIVLSQGFINSEWCQEEFTKCLKENGKDPAFEILVILMQEADSLVKVPDNMKFLFDNKTYSKKEDPKLFEKIAKRLALIKGYDVNDDTKRDKTQNNDEENPHYSINKKRQSSLNIDDEDDEHMNMLH